MAYDLRSHQKKDFASYSKKGQELIIEALNESGRTYPSFEDFLQEFQKECHQKEEFECKPLKRSWSKSNGASRKISKQLKREA